MSVRMASVADAMRAAAPQALATITEAALRRGAHTMLVQVAAGALGMAMCTAEMTVAWGGVRRCDDSRARGCGRGKGCATHSAGDEAVVSPTLLASKAL